MALEVLVKQDSTSLAEYKDILTYLITIVGIIVAFLSVFATYILGRKYIEHVSEIKLISDKYSEVQKWYEESQNANKRTLQRLSYGFDFVARLLILRKRLDEMKSALVLLRTESLWLGRRVGSTKQGSYAMRSKSINQKGDIRPENWNCTACHLILLIGAGISER